VIPADLFRLSPGPWEIHDLNLVCGAYFQHSLVAGPGAGFFYCELLRALH
jgi:hypothetical protein